jgi:Cys-rich repeat protein
MKGSGGAGGHGQMTTGNGGTNGNAGSGGGMACTTSASCGRRGVCDTTAGVCVECLASTDCNNQVCDVASHTCVDCLANKDCPTATPSCSSGHTCGDMCTKSADCPNALPVCEVATHACVECLVDADCGAGGVCQADLTCQ